MDNVEEAGPAAAAGRKAVLPHFNPFKTETPD